MRFKTDGFFLDIVFLKIQMFFIYERFNLVLSGATKLFFPVFNTKFFLSGLKIYSLIK